MTDLKINEFNLTRNDAHEVVAYQIVQVGDKLYQMQCREGNGFSDGFNTDTCVRLSTPTGWSYVVDNRLFNIKAPTPKHKTPDANRQIVIAIFQRFIEYLKEINP